MHLTSRTILKLLLRLPRVMLFLLSKNIENLNEKWDKLEKILGLDSESKILSYVAIDPQNNDEFDENFIIDTNKMANDSNIGKLRNVLKKLLKSEGKQLDL